MVFIRILGWFLSHFKDILEAKFDQKRIKKGAEFLSEFPMNYGILFKSILASTQTLSLDWPSI